MNPHDADLHLSDSAGGPTAEVLSWEGRHMAPTGETVNVRGKCDTDCGPCACGAWHPGNQMAPAAVDAVHSEPISPEDEAEIADFYEQADWSENWRDEDRRHRGNMESVHAQSDLIWRTGFFYGALYGVMVGAVCASIVAFVSANT